MADLDITVQVAWFLDAPDRALFDAEAVLAAILRKGRFRDRMAGLPVNKRQREVLSRLLDGFEGRPTSSKRVRIAGCSQDAALRDIGGLIGHGMLVQDADGGRGTSYGLTSDAFD